MRCILVLLCCALLSGCVQRQPQLDTRYGTCAGASINGVSVFVDVLREQGHEVSCEPFVFDGVLDGFDTVILVHDGFGPLPQETVQTIENYRSGPGKGTQIVLLLRDYDAAISYLEAMEQKPEVQHDPKVLEQVQAELRERKERFLAATSEPVELAEGRWFGLDTVAPDGIRKKGSLRDFSRGDRQYGRLRDNLDLSYRRRLVLPAQSRALWMSAVDVLLAELDDKHGAVFIVANGSFLLNGALVHPGNRGLAEDFAQMLGRDFKTVVIESSQFVEGAEESLQSRLISTWPNPVVLLHVALVLGLFCWARFPIFGRPREASTAQTRRFGRHVEALGDLLAANGLRKYAERRLQKHFRSATKRPRMRGNRALGSVTIAAKEPHDDSPDGI